MSENDMGGSERPEYDGMMTVIGDEGDEFWVHTASRLGEVKGEKIDKFAKIRIIETREVRTLDTDSDPDE